VPIDPDCLRNLTEIIISKGYPCEEYDVITDDGYILKTFRIPSSKKEYKNGVIASNKPVVLLMHGLLDYAFTWVLNFPYESLPYILADQGFDVWMSNSRGSKYCKRHTHLDPNSKEFWQFSWDEMAKYDLPTNVKYILQKTGAQTIGYVGHSQGTTQAFASFIIHPEIAAKINVFVALAPVTNATFVTNPFMRLLADLQIDTILDFFGEKQFLPTPGVLEKYFEAFCRLDPIICDDIVELIVGKHKGSFNESRMQVMASHEPGGTSVHNMAHWGQSIRKGSYSMFDYGAQENKKRYNSTTPPAYDIKKLPRNLPIGIFYGEADELASAKGVKQLIASLPTPPVLVKDVPQYAHLDFCWCTQAYKDIYESVVSLLQQYKPKNYLLLS